MRHKVVWEKHCEILDVHVEMIFLNNVYYMKSYSSKGCFMHYAGLIADEALRYCQDVWNSTCEAKLRHHNY